MDVGICGRCHRCSLCNHGQARRCYGAMGVQSCVLCERRDVQRCHVELLCPQFEGADVSAGHGAQLWKQFPSFGACRILFVRRAGSPAVVCWSGSHCPWHLGDQHRQQKDFGEPLQEGLGRTGDQKHIIRISLVIHSKKCSQMNTKELTLIGLIHLRSWIRDHKQRCSEIQTGFASGDYIRGDEPLIFICRYSKEDGLLN